MSLGRKSWATDRTSIAVAATEAAAERTVLAVARLLSAEGEEKNAISRLVERRGRKSWKRVDANASEVASLRSLNEEHSKEKTEEEEEEEPTREFPEAVRVDCVDLKSCRMTKVPFMQCHVYLRKRIDQEEQRG